MQACDNVSATGRFFDVMIEVPRWSFVKRGADPRIDFISPLPCPYNYGAITDYIGLDGDYLDAIVLGPRASRGATRRTQVRAVIGLTDRGLYDDKVICSDRPLRAIDRFLLLNFFRAYAMFKRVLNFLRAQSGPTHCDGWQDPAAALERANPSHGAKAAPHVRF